MKDPARQCVVIEFPDMNGVSEKKVCLAACPISGGFLIALLFVNLLCASINLLLVCAFIPR
jgi:hypothetical protein